MHLREPRLRLLSRVHEPLVVALSLEFSETRIEGGLFAEESVAPDVGFEHGVEGRRVVAGDLRSRSEHCAEVWGLGTADLLFDEQDRDMGRNWDVTHGDVAQQCGLSDTVASDETVPPPVSEGKGCS